jgi:hypothetical protein
MKQMSTANAQRARSIGHRLTDARRAGDSDKEFRYRKRARALVDKFGYDAQREIANGRREQLRRTRK